MKVLITDNLTGLTEEVEMEEIELPVAEEMPPTAEERIEALESAVLEMILGGGAV